MARKKPSPAITLLTTIWDNQGHQMGHSWERLNHAMCSALHLAIRAGLRFDLTDFATIDESFRMGYWGDHERCYSIACGFHERHGPNMSAALAYEAWKGRKPFLVLARPRGKVRLRVAVGTDLMWYEHSKVLRLECTSFAEDGKSFTACVYEWTGDTRKVVRRLKITHDKIVAYHADIRRRLKEAGKPHAPDEKD